MHLVVVSAYHICSQQFDATTITVTTQQTQLLLQQGATNPYPKTQFINDLITQIQQWRSKGIEVLIGMDANEDVETHTPKSQEFFGRWI